MYIVYQNFDVGCTDDQTRGNLVKGSSIAVDMRVYGGIMCLTKGHCP